MKKTYFVSLSAEIESDMSLQELQNKLVFGVLTKDPNEIGCNEKNDITGHGIDIMDYTDMVVEKL